jgi:hypothetical protein
VQWSRVTPCRRLDLEIACQAERLESFVDDGLVDGVPADWLVEEVENARDQARNEAMLAETFDAWAEDREPNYVRVWAWMAARWG